MIDQKEYDRICGEVSALLFMCLTAYTKGTDIIGMWREYAAAYIKMWHIVAPDVAVEDGLKTKASDEFRAVVKNKIETLIDDVKKMKDGFERRN